MIRKVLRKAEAKALNEGATQLEMELAQTLKQAEKYLQAITGTTVFRKYYPRALKEEIEAFIDPLLALIRLTEEMHGYCEESCGPDCRFQGVDKA